MSPYHNHMDTELVDLLRQGNHQAFEVIYRRYAKELFRYALRKIKVREDCEELMHDVFESLWKRREELMITSLRHYLFTSVRYMVIRYFSHREVKRKFAEHYQLFEAVYETMDADQPRDPEAIHATLLQHLHTLPDRCQEAIRLRITENLSNGEIARRMNIHKGTVQLYISKAFAHLRGSCRAEIYRAID
jgi:RNA polymerase sigma-70 factor (family 1)